MELKREWSCHFMIQCNSSQFIPKITSVPLPHFEIHCPSSCPFYILDTASKTGLRALCQKLKPKLDSQSRCSTIWLRPWPTRLAPTASPPYITQTTTQPAQCLLSTYLLQLFRAEHLGGGGEWWLRGSLHLYQALSPKVKHVSNHRTPIREEEVRKL